MPKKRWVADTNATVLHKEGEHYLIVDADIYVDYFEKYN